MEKPIFVTQNTLLLLLYLPQTIFDSLLSLRSLNFYNDKQLLKTNTFNMTRGHTQIFYNTSRDLLGLVAYFFNPIPHGGGGHYVPDGWNQSAISTGLEIGSPKFMTLFLSRFARSYESHFWNFFFEIFKKLTFENFWGPRACSEN